MNKRRLLAGAPSELQTSQRACCIGADIDEGIAQLKELIVPDEGAAGAENQSRCVVFTSVVFWGERTSSPTGSAPAARPPRKAATTASSRCRLASLTRWRTECWWMLNPQWTSTLCFRAEGSAATRPSLVVLGAGSWRDSGVLYVSAMEVSAARWNLAVPGVVWTVGI